MLSVTTWTDFEALTCSSLVLSSSAVSLTLVCRLNSNPLQEIWLISISGCWLVLFLPADEKQRQFAEEDGPLEMTAARVDRDVVSRVRNELISGEGWDSWPLTFTTKVSITSNLWTFNLAANPEPHPGRHRVLRHQTSESCGGLQRALQEEEDQEEQEEKSRRWELNLDFCPVRPTRTVHSRKIWKLRDVADWIRICRVIK